MVRSDQRQPERPGTCTMRQLRGTLTNVDCPYRGRCLADAWISDPDTLDCTGCAHIGDRESSAAISRDALGAMRLLWAVFINERMAERLPAETAMRTVLGPRPWGAPAVLCEETHLRSSNLAAL